MIIDKNIITIKQKSDKKKLSALQHKGLLVDSEFPIM